MPDVHLIFTPAMDGTRWSYALPMILKGIKRSLWQHESFDHELKRDESLRERRSLCVQIRFGDAS